MIVLAGEEKPKSKSQLDGAAAGEGEGMHRCRSPTLRSSYRGLRPYESSLHMFGSIMPWCMLLAGERGNRECTPRCGFLDGSLYTPTDPCSATGDYNSVSLYYVARRI